MAALNHVRLRLDATVRRLADGRVLVGGSPLTVMRLTDVGRRTIDRLRLGDDLAPRGLVERLLDNGMAHPVVDATSPPPLTVVIPCRDDPAVHGLARSLVADGHRVVVVDDGSAEPLAIEGALVLRNDRARGPAAARNRGLAAVTTDLVAFVDADVELRPGCLGLLAAHLADPATVLAAPRILTSSGPGVRARYEATDGSLDLGPEAGRIRARTRVSYVPAAVLLARTDVMRSAGGFDEGLRFGEDVDLIWRLDGAGHRLRYEPAATATHRLRGTWRGWLRQRRHYGSSAAPLASRHGNAVAPAVLSAWSVGVWAAVIARHRLVALALAATTTVTLSRKLSNLPQPLVVAAELTGRGHLAAGRVLAQAVTRGWWPALVVLAPWSRLARRALGASALVPALVRWRESGTDLDPLRFVAVRLADDVAYSVGVWEGCWREGSLAALTPDLST